MNTLIHLTQTILPLLTTVVLGCFGLLPQMRAAPQVVPTPDGCYPNFTTAEGCDALSLLTTGSGNTALGWRSLFFDSTGSFNTGVGGGALALNNADSNTAVGAAALLLNSSGTANTATGTDALVFNESSSFNTANGAFALFNHTTGNDSTAVGYKALFNGGGQNTAVGSVALFNNMNQNNTAIGVSALGNATGQGNIGIGAFAGNNITTGDFNIEIFAGGDSGDDRTIRIGGATQTATYIAGISGQPAIGGDAVLITSDGKLGTVNFSSERFKEEIKPMDNASEAILALNPITFRYKSEIDPKGILQFGLLAEEVDKVSNDLVKRDAKGEIYTVRYDAVNAMLLNEFLKEHKAFVEEQRKVRELSKDFRATIAQQQKQIDALTAGLEKVSARLAAASPSPGGLEASKFATGRIRRGGPAPRVVNNP